MRGRKGAVCWVRFIDTTRGAEEHRGFSRVSHRGAITAATGIDFCLFLFINLA